MQTTTYKLNITPGGVPLTIHISQYDVGLRQYIFQPYTSEGEFTYVTGATVTLEATKPDGYAVIHNCTYNQDGSITYTVQAQLAAVPGRVWSKVVIRNGNNILGTGAVVWMVDNAGVKDNAIVSDSDISALQQWMDDVESYAEQADGSAQAAASSVTLAEAAATQAAGYVDQAVILGGTPLVAATVSAMSDHDRVYVYTGSETGYTAGNWYYWNGSAWTSGGIYNSSAVQTDPTLSVSGMAADAASAGELKDGLRIVLDNYTTQAPFVVIGATPYTTSLIGNKVLNKDGVVSNANGSAYKVTDYISVKYGQFVFFTYTRARWNNKNYAFYDENYNVIATNEKTASSTTTLENYIVQVPDGAAYFVLGIDINSVSGDPDIKVAVVTMWRENQSPVPSDVIYNISPDGYTEAQVSGTITASAFFTYAGTIFRNGTLATYTINEVSVEYGEVLNIYNARASYSYPQYAFFDIAGQMIQMHRDNDNNLHDYKFIPVPFGAVKLIISGANTSGPYCTKITEIYGSGYKWKDIKWTAVGDSITEENSRATKRYFDYISDVTGITVVNQGESGTGYMKAYNDNLPFYQRTAQIPTDSDVITIFGSVNDASLTLGNPTDTGTTTVCGCINSTIDSIRSRVLGANLGIITPLPTETYPTTTAGNNLDLYADAIVNICKLKGVPCLDMYHESNMTPWESAFKTAYYTHDDGNGTHPDENGHRLFAPRIKAFLETLLM